MKYLYLGFAIVLLACLLPLPYGAYTLIRFAAMVVFAVIAVKYYNEQKIPLTVVFAALALLFQPFVKIHLGRTVWNVVDVIVAALLIGLALYELKAGKEKE